MRPPIRLAALMDTGYLIFTMIRLDWAKMVQPINQLNSCWLCVLFPSDCFRPADATETIEAWRFAILQSTWSTALILSRQNLPVLDRKELAPAKETQKGGYILWESNNDPQLILISTGSEVHISLQAGKQLASEGFAVSVVSMPSWEVFDKQSDLYKEKVLPGKVRARIAVEAATPLGWEHYVGLDGIIVGVDHFGASAPGGVLYRNFGITSENVVEQARKLLK